MTALRRALSDFCEFVQGGRHGKSGNDFVDVGFPAYGAGGMNGLLPTYEFERSAVVLSAIGARCGKCFFVEGKWSSLANTQVIFPDAERAVGKFLWYQLNDESRWPRAGTGQPFIKPSDVKRHLVFLPGLSEQRRIAGILDQADDIRTKRRETIVQVERLSQSIFVDMFGDPASNPRGWPVKTVADMCEVKGGKRLPKGEEYSTEPTAFRYIRVTDLRDGGIEEGALVYLKPDVQRMIRNYTVNAGDVIISIAGSIGLIATVPQSVAGANLTENAAKLVPRALGEYEAEFLAATLRSSHVQAQIESHIGQVTIGKLALFRIEKLEFFLPPIALQRAYVSRLQQALRLRESLSRSLRASNDLFTALRHRAFSGVL